MGLVLCWRGEEDKGKKGELMRWGKGRKKRKKNGWGGKKNRCGRKKTGGAEEKPGGLEKKPVRLEKNPCGW